MSWMARLIGLTPPGRGEPDRELLSKGLNGTALVTRLEQTTITSGALRSSNYRVVCDIELDVTLGSGPPYQAAVRQQLTVEAASRIRPGRTVVKVRVDPDDHAHVAIDLTEPLP